MTITESRSVPHRRARLEATNTMVRPESRQAGSWCSRDYIARPGLGAEPAVPSGSSSNSSLGPDISVRNGITPPSALDACLSSPASCRSPVGDRWNSSSSWRARMSVSIPPVGAPKRHACSATRSEEARRPRWPASRREKVSRHPYRRAKLTGKLERPESAVGWRYLSTGVL